MKHLFLLLSLMLAVSCGKAQPHCLKSNCNGCCDVNGECRRGNENFACGFGANTCGSCSQNEQCVSGSCAATSSDGGIIIAPPDGGCSATTCGGCCDTGSICRGGNSNGSCGLSGAACVACPTGKSCQSNTCQTFVCGGCISTTGNCLLGTGAQACGVDGGMCQACLNGQTCASGMCVAATGCNSTNCAGGCCDGTTCVNNTTAQKCGTNGNACIACQAPNVCNAGQCTTATQDAGPTGPCGPTTCPNGCCDVLDGHCTGGTGTLSCGKNGVTCELCTDFPFICLDHACF